MSLTDSASRTDGPDALDGVEFFEVLDAASRQELLARVRRRTFAAGDVVCREGDEADSLFVMTGGVAHATVSTLTGVHKLGVLRRGDVVGEMSLLTGEPRSATVTCAVPSEAAEFDRDLFANLIGEHPAILSALTRTLVDRLARANVAPIRREGRGEALGLVVTPAAFAYTGAMLDAAMAATPRSVATTGWPPADDPGDQAASRDATLVALDDLLHDHATVVVGMTPGPDLDLLLAHLDRIVVLGALAEVSPVLRRTAPGVAVPELVLMSGGRGPSPDSVEGVPVLRTIDPNSQAHQAWLGRLLTRTRLGLSLGAGGAKGYAHVGALRALEAAGFHPDAVSGSSIGAIVAALVALGSTAGEIEATFRRTFTPDVVKDILTLSLAGTSVGAETMRRVCHDLVGDVTFDDLRIPLAVMTVDLNTRAPAPITSGSVADALTAATALAGLFPPYVRGEQRLVDGLALVPVPLDSVREAGSDVAVAINLMSQDTLEAWPGQTPPEPEPPGRVRLLETLLDVMDLAHVDASVRHARRADIAITPLFGPCSWRDFHLADLFIEAGRQAAQRAIPAVSARARPSNPTEG